MRTFFKTRKTEMEWNKYGKPKKENKELYEFKWKYVIFFSLLLNMKYFTSLWKRNKKSQMARLEGWFHFFLRSHSTDACIHLLRLCCILSLLIVIGIFIHSGKIFNAIHLHQNLIIHSNVSPLMNIELFYSSNCLLLLISYQLQITHSGYLSLGDLTLF